MISKSALRVFLTKWRAAFRDHDPAKRCDPKKPDYWEEGQSAYKALKKEGLLGAITLQRDHARDDPDWRYDWRAREAMHLLMRELNTYQTYRKKLIELNQRFKDLVEFLHRMEKWFAKQQKQTSDTSTGRLFSKYLRMIRSDIASIVKKHSSVWLPTPGVWGRVLHQPKRHRVVPVRVLELDGLFQARIGAIFRAFLDQESGVSLRTISRLVVLFYLCADLADDREGRLIIRSTGTELTVGAVDQKLKRSGLE